MTMAHLLRTGPLLLLAAILLLPNTLSAADDEFQTIFDGRSLIGSQDIPGNGGIVITHEFVRYKNIRVKRLENAST